MKVINRTKHAQISQQDLRTLYKFLDNKGNQRGQLLLSELEAQVLEATLKSGDLMIAKFNIVK